MAAMKLVTLALLALAPEPASAALGRHRHLAARRAALPQNVKGCVAKASAFLQHPTDKRDAIDRAEEYCEEREDINDKASVCPHFKEVVESALDHFEDTDQVSAKQLCEATEQYAEEMSAIPKVPNVGGGSLVRFKLSPKCEHAVAASLAHSHAQTLSPRDVPDFWYSFCVNQDCAHFLPSRSRWCDVERQPAHSVRVCEGIRKFALDEAEADTAEGGPMGPAQICGVFTEFAEETSLDIQAYDRVIHDLVPLPRMQEQLEPEHPQSLLHQHQFGQHGGSEEDTHSGAAAASIGLVASALAVLPLFVL